MKTLFYCQHSIGIGHLMRTVRLAEASLSNGAVSILCGGKVPPQLHLDPRIKIVPLPPLMMDAESQLADADGKQSTEKIFARRHAIAVRTVRDFDPDALVIEMFPFGRKKFAAEILAIIEAARARGKARIFSSVRDVLITTRRDQQRHDARAVAWLNAHFDAVLIHSDPQLIRLDASFRPFEEISIPTYYTGYIGGSAPRRRADRARKIVVSAGGGRVGQQLVAAACAAYPRIKRTLGLEMLVITGPNGRVRQSRGGRRRGPRTVTFINNLPDIMARCMLSMSQCGYNTAVDVLQAGVPAVFVPFETAAENEQRRRARLLCDSGYATLLREKSLTAETLGDAAARALDRSPRHDCRIDLNGATRSSELMRQAYAHA